MKPQSLDTHPKAEAVQIRLLQHAGPLKRIWLMRSLSQTVLTLSRRTLREVNPDLSEQALKVLFVRQCYGVLKVQHEHLDLPYLRHWVAELGLADLFTQACRDAGIEGE